MPNLSDVSSEDANNVDDANMLKTSEKDNNIVELDDQSVRIKLKRIESPQHNKIKINIHHLTTIDTQPLILIAKEHMKLIKQYQNLPCYLHS